MGSQRADRTYCRFHFMFWEILQTSPISTSSPWAVTNVVQACSARRWLRSGRVPRNSPSELYLTQKYPSTVLWSNCDIIPNLCTFPWIARASRRFPSFPSVMSPPICRSSVYPPITRNWFVLTMTAQVRSAPYRRGNCLPPVKIGRISFKVEFFTYFSPFLHWPMGEMMGHGFHPRSQ